MTDLDRIFIIIQLRVHKVPGRFTWINPVICFYSTVAKQKLFALENKPNNVKEFSNYVVLVLAGLNDARFKNGFLT